jgi:hypothetical protein
MVWLLPQEFMPTTHVLNEKRGDLGTFTQEPACDSRVLDWTQKENHSLA